MTSTYDLALQIIEKLHAAGFVAYFAGGWVRDHVMGKESDDIDIATDAPPKKILDLFPRTLVIGLSFGVVIVIIEGHPFEVATFRTDVGSDGRKPDSIVFSSPKEDAIRRDFTINGMFYDPSEHKIYDYVGGMEDIKKSIIKTIGDPYDRFFEDRLRMVRAFRFAARFGFTIDSKTQEAILANAERLFPSVAMERIFQEFSKMAKSARFDWALIEMHRLMLLPVIFPSLGQVHLQEIKKRVKPFPLMPKNMPVILYLAHLFPDYSLKEFEDLVFYLKCGKDSLLALQSYLKAKELLQKLKNKETIDLFSWVEFLSKEKAEMAFISFLLTFEEESERDKALEKVTEVKERLKAPILRASKNQTLLTGERLKSEGIRPGRLMGDLIKEAEKIAITEETEDLEKVMIQLKKTSLWQEAKNL